MCRARCVDVQDVCARRRARRARCVDVQAVCARRCVEQDVHVHVDVQDVCARTRRCARCVCVHVDV